MSHSSIFEIEKLLFNKEYHVAANMLNEMVVNLRKGTHFAITLVPDKIEPELTAIYTRFAQCLHKLFIDPAYYKMPVNTFASWLFYARELRAIFTISGYYRTDFMINTWDAHLKVAIAQHSQGTPCLERIEQLVMRILLFSMLENNTSMDLTVFFNFFPALTQAALMSLLSSNVIVTVAGSAKREYLLGLTTLLNKVEITQPYELYDIAAAWLQATYALRHDKHTIKQFLNASILRWLRRENFIKDVTCKPYDATLAKPTLLIVLEYFSAAHSMGRSYNLAVMDLKEKFHLIGLALHVGEASDLNYAIFDRVISLNCLDSATFDLLQLPQQLQTVMDLQVDIIFYPSIGMHHTGIVLANLRLAPIQIMSFGHPASSFCDAIDYGIIEADYAPGAEDLFSEKMIVLPPESLLSQPLTTLQHFMPSAKQEQAVLNIAVSSVLAKVSAIFLQVCKKIAEQSQRRVRFSFFINESEIFYLQCKKIILNLLPDAQVFQRLPPETYVKYLDECDLYLSTFPFGGANSVIDALCVGLPVVCLRNDEIAGRTDSALISRRGLPSYLVAHSEEDYIATALRLIHNDAERLALSKMILEHSKELFPENNSRYQQQAHYFSAACWEIYKKHHLLQQAPTKTFTLAELQDLKMT